MKSAHDEFRDLYEYKLATLDMMKRNVIHNITPNDGMRMTARCYDEFDVILHRHITKNKGVKKFHDTVYPHCCKKSDDKYGFNPVIWSQKNWMPTRAHPLWYMYKSFNVIQRTFQFFQLMQTNEQSPAYVHTSSALRPCDICKGTTGLCYMTSPSDENSMKAFTSCRSED